LTTCKDIMNYAVVLLFILFTLFIQSSIAEAADTENCMMCHKYRFLGRIDEDGIKHNYNVDQMMYNHSVHRNVPCSDCHTYIEKIPHDPVTQKVNCANICHIKPPFSQEKFSHEKIIKIFKQSVHGIKDSDSETLKKAQPDCKFCHLNPLFTKISEDIINYDETLRRCFNCHEEKGVVQAYKHITHRLRHKTSRSPQEIVELCSKCHADKSLMEKLGAPEKVIDAVETYNRSIHGKLVRLGSQRAADCISCHATNALHDIYKPDNKNSTINEMNIQNTCRQCHTRTNSWFIKVAVHPPAHGENNPILYFMSIILRLAIYGSVLSLVGLMLFETFGRRKKGVYFILRDGSSWRRKITVNKR
jgi:hypothetical protein